MCLLLVYAVLVSSRLLLVLFQGLAAFCKDVGLKAIQGLGDGVWGLRPKFDVEGSRLRLNT